MNYFLKTSCHSERTFQELKIFLPRVEERLSFYNMILINEEFY